MDNVTPGKQHNIVPGPASIVVSTVYSVVIIFLICRQNITYFKLITLQALHTYLIDIIWYEDSQHAWKYFYSQGYNARQEKVH